MVVGVGTSGARLRSVTMAVVGIVGLLVAYSSVNDFSGNWLETRYGESSSSPPGAPTWPRRIWTSGPTTRSWVWGPEPAVRSLGGRSGVAARTEYTRMLAEHGLLGLLAVGLLGSMFVSDASAQVGGAMEPAVRGQHGGVGSDHHAPRRHPTHSRRAGVRLDPAPGRARHVEPTTARVHKGKL